MTWTMRLWQLSNATRAAHLRSLLLLTVASRGFVAVLCLAAQLCFPVYDHSTALFFPSSCVSSADRAVIAALSPLLRWDALHLLSVARDGYLVEQHAAWFPLYPAVLRALSTVVRIGLPLCPSTSLLLSAVLLNQLLFALSVPLLYGLVLRLSESARLAYLSAVFFVLSPATVFFIAPYTESAFTFLSLCGCLLFAHDRPLSSSLLFALSAAVRSNGALYALFPASALLRAVWRWWGGEGRQRGALLLLPLPLLRTAAWATSCAAVIGAPSLLFGRWSAAPYCSALSSLRPLPSYCASLLPASMYAAVQQRYWGVGFLRYYTAQQAPNFLLAAPVLALSLVALRAAFAPSSTSVLSVHRRPGMLPYAFVHCALLLTALTVLHVQVATRFILSALPTPYLCMAEQWEAVLVHSGGAKQSRTGWQTAHLLWAWCIGYLVLGTVFFTLFLPWT